AAINAITDADFQKSDEDILGDQHTGTNNSSSSATEAGAATQLLGSSNLLTQNGSGSGALGFFLHFCKKNSGLSIWNTLKNLGRPRAVTNSTETSASSSDNSYDEAVAAALGHQLLVHAVRTKTGRLAVVASCFYKN
ncbi:unnamed protein product, partial [Amoebophrya sp. A120]